MSYNVGAVATTQSVQKPQLSAMDVLKYIDIDIDGKPLVSRDITDPNERAQALIKAYKEKYSLSANELPSVASVIKKAILSSKIKTDTRINISEDYLKDFIIPNARKLKDPHSQMMEATVTGARNLDRSATASRVPQIDRKDLNLNPSPDLQSAEALPPIKQNGKTLLLCKVLTNNQLAPSANLESVLQDLWKKQGQAHVIAAKHTEFMVQPKIFIGDTLNPEILKLLVNNYLSRPRQNVEVLGDRLVIKSPKGNPLATVFDPKIIQRYLSQTSRN